MTRILDLKWWHFCMANNGLDQTQIERHLTDLIVQNTEI